MKPSTRKQIAIPTGIFCAAALLAAPATAQFVEPPVGPGDTASSLPGVKPVQVQVSEAYETPPDGAVLAVTGTRTPIVLTPQEHIPGTEDSMVSDMPQPALGSTIGKHMLYDQQNGVQWAMGADYKASASSTGFSYMPFLGSEAPKTYEFKLRLSSATLGGEAIALDKGAVVERRGDRMTLDRGPIDVFYDLSTTSVEQSFELEAFGVDAELVLDIAVDSELPLQEGAQGILYAGDLGGVTYSHAVVVDGAGQRLELPISASQDNLRLVVPASYMRNSVAPVVVDPIIATYQVHAGSSRNLRYPDVAYDLSSNTFAYVHQSEWSATDFDIYIETYGGNSHVLVDLQTVDFTGEDTRHPNVTNDNTSNQFLVASRRLNTDGRWDIIGRMMDATDISQKSAIFDIATASGASGSAGGWENNDYDVGGKSQGASLFKVVWERHFFSANYTNIRTNTVTPTSPFVVGYTPAVSGYLALTTGASNDDRRVKISESSGEADLAEWRVVFIRNDVGTGDQSLYTALYADDNTQTLAPTVFSNINTSWTVVSLDVTDGTTAIDGPAAGTPVYMAAMHAIGPVNNADIWLYGLQGGSDFQLSHLTLSEHQNLGMRPRYPAVATTNSRFAVAYTEFDIINGGYTCYSSSVDLSDDFHFAVTDRRSVVADVGSSWDGVGPGAASRYSGGNYTSRYVGAAATVVDAGVYTQQAAVVFPSQASTAGYQYCNGTANSTGDYGFIYLAGTHETTGGKTLYASTMPQNQFGYFLVGHGGTGTITPPGSNGLLCIFGAPFGRYNLGIEIQFTGATGTFDLGINPTAIRSNAGNVVGMSGETYNFQAWYRENGGFSNFTNAVSLTFN
ncbi:MAG: hypothetical protein GY930_20470 [bacterium]|nr:hypothetical protein [bacterium]